MQNILVTGGAGYIGSHACKVLKNAGYQPVTFDNFVTGWRDAVKYGPLFEGDLCDPASVAAAFEEYNP
ncbi:MAG: NAD-dependent epimerase/dehydratase family protein, partial [Halocynthiibacter sp.]